jgi:5-methylcytosine-specific restriction endonuclease McrA
MRKWRAGHWSSYTKAQLVIKRDKKCELCGYALVPEILCVHHKIEVRDGGSDGEDNLIVLCPNCHALEHQKKEKHKTLEDRLYWYNRSDTHKKRSTAYYAKNREKINARAKLRYRERKENERASSKRS